MPTMKSLIVRVAMLDWQLENWEFAFPESRHVLEWAREETYQKVLELNPSIRYYRECYAIGWAILPTRLGLIDPTKN